MNFISAAKPKYASGLIRLLLLSIGIVLIGLYGCSFDNNVANPEYQLQFNKAADHIRNNNYDEAEKSFTALIEMLEKEPSQSLQLIIIAVAILQGDLFRF